MDQVVVPPGDARGMVVSDGHKGHHDHGHRDWEGTSERVRGQSTDLERSLLARDRDQSVAVERNFNRTIIEKERIFNRINELDKANEVRFSTVMSAIKYEGQLARDSGAASELARTQRELGDLKLAGVIAAAVAAGKAACTPA